MLPIIGERYGVVRGALGERIGCERDAPSGALGYYQMLRKVGHCGLTRQARASG